MFFQNINTLRGDGWHGSKYHRRCVGIYCVGEKRAREYIASLLGPRVIFDLFTVRRASCYVSCSIGLISTTCLLFFPPPSLYLSHSHTFAHFYSLIILNPPHSLYSYIVVTPWSETTNMRGERYSGKDGVRLFWLGTGVGRTLVVSRQPERERGRKRKRKKPERERGTIEGGKTKVGERSIRLEL
jgi:hypothetical protein